MTKYAHWVPIPLRLIVGYGFMAHGYAKVLKGPERFVDIVHAMGVPMPELMASLQPTSSIPITHTLDLLELPQIVPSNGRNGLAYRTGSSPVYVRLERPRSRDPV